MNNNANFYELKLIDRRATDERLLAKAAATNVDVGDNDDPDERPRIVWTYVTDPREILRYTTIYCITSFVVFVMYCNFQVDSLRGASISTMMGSSKISTLIFTFIVYLHSYSLESYLVILAEFLGTNSFQFKFIALNCVIYIISLVVLTYLPVEEYAGVHNIFAVLALFFASLSIFIHKHSFFKCFYSSTTQSTLQTNAFILSTSEFFFLIVVLATAFIFWFTSSAICEYIFIGFILVDREFKINIMVRAGIINIKDNAMVVVYILPPNAESVQRMRVQSNVTYTPHNLAFQTSGSFGGSRRDGFNSRWLVPSERGVFTCQGHSEVSAKRISHSR